ncbi:hypothetical protein BLNAU_5012 [Blattamonas nauphoetae]|uniref:Uncharacterized protein n=1 Tax=Blattamonas nauphoetae TaxID=2049346 RepID=A0ABQ9Y8V4_9EUKA|nr:hypothetical protein BLNAU_5012 [Blattamonas nauphoetae]
MESTSITWDQGGQVQRRSINQSAIGVQISALLHSELELTQDSTKIATGSGEKGRVEVSKEGCLINKIDFHTHSLTLDSLLISLTSDRTTPLLVSKWNAVSGELLVRLVSFILIGLETG